MTIAINLKVNDGVVLAADSATTLVTRQGDTSIALNVYNNANKIFNLRKGLPIGLMTWGSGSIGLASIATLAKDFRSRLSGKSNDHQDWTLDLNANYQLSDIAQRVKEFFFEELYVPAFAAWPQKPALGFVVAGYSKPAAEAEEYVIQIDDHGNCIGPVEMRSPMQVGVSWNGMGEPLNRLLLGFSSAIYPALEAAVPEAEKAKFAEAFANIRAQIGAPLVQAAMPLQDAIDLAEYLAELTVSFSRFAPGASIVGGPIEIAAITKHEHFKWVKRKHYYHRSFNPEGMLQDDND